MPLDRWVDLAAGLEETMKIYSLGGDRRIGKKAVNRQGEHSFSIPGDTSARDVEAGRETTAVDSPSIDCHHADGDGGEAPSRNRTIARCEESIDVLKRFQIMCAEGNVDIPTMTHLLGHVASAAEIPPGDPLRDLLDHINERLAIEAAKLSAGTADRSGA